jgi:hypothetical protein
MGLKTIYEGPSFEDGVKAIGLVLMEEQARIEREILFSFYNKNKKMLSSMTEKQALAWIFVNLGENITSKEYRKLKKQTLGQAFNLMKQWKDSP